ncbi:unnamed protein product, partial [Staurois parvus]
RWPGSPPRLGGPAPAAHCLGGDPLRLTPRLDVSALGARMPPLRPGATRACCSAARGPAACCFLPRGPAACLLPPGGPVPAAPARWARCLLLATRPGNSDVPLPGSPARHDA